MTDKPVADNDFARLVGKTIEIPENITLVDQAGIEIHYTIPIRADVMRYIPAWEMIQVVPRTGDDWDGETVCLTETAAIVCTIAGDSQ